MPVISVYDGIKEKVPLFYQSYRKKAYNVTKNEYLVLNILLKF